MSARLQELAFRDTPMGEISLRRRRDPQLGVDVYEVKLGEEFLMSSAFTEGEVQLSRLGLAQAGPGPLDVVVGGLGLGYTARAALADPRVASLTVVEALEDVVDWHRRDLLPDTVGLAADPRVRLVQGDFFARVAAGDLDPEQPGRRFDAVLLDVDHTPTHHLHPSHAGFYSPDGLRRLLALLRPGGVFALWSDVGDDAFAATLAGVATHSAVHEVVFANPLTGGTSSNVVFTARP
ncbi:spermidine synthase [Geodermatophilaceae bacterium NBWT11]|nr:spermidine synthase [Geodermatophilaceae bacterium NBWT11]